MTCFLQLVQSEFYTHCRRQTSNTHNQIVKNFVNEAMFDLFNMLDKKNHKK